jgi:hypothetical protein
MAMSAMLEVGFEPLWKTDMPMVAEPFTSRVFETVYRAVVVAQSALSGPNDERAPTRSVVTTERAPTRPMKRPSPRKAASLTPTVPPLPNRFVLMIYAEYNKVLMLSHHFFYALSLVFISNWG